MRHRNVDRSRHLDSWEQFLLLEHRLITALDWIEPGDRNFSCYSKALASLIADCYPSLEAIALGFAPDNTGFTPHPDRAIFHSVLRHHHPDIHQFSVGLAGYDLQIRPWGMWRSSDALPDWWVAAAELRSEPGRMLERATLRNCLNAVSGLFLLLILSGEREVPELTPGNRLLQAGDYLTRKGAEAVLRG